MPGFLGLPRGSWLWTCLRSSFPASAVLGWFLGSVAPLQGAISVRPLLLLPFPAALSVGRWIRSIRCCAKPVAVLGLVLPEAGALGMVARGLFGLQSALLSSTARRACWDGPVMPISFRLYLLFSIYHGFLIEELGRSNGTEPLVPKSLFTHGGRPVSMGRS